MIDLNLVTEDDLWEEIKKRNDAVIMVTLKSYDENREGVQVNYHGGKFVCMGLTSYCAMKLDEAAGIEESEFGGES